MSNSFETGSDGVGEVPELNQIFEYRGLMVDILHKLGRGVRHARIGERASTRLGTEYYLPGAYDEERIVGMHDTHPPRLERQRRYSASFRQRVGDRAGRLLVLESDSVYIAGVDSYATKRRMYRFSWDDDPIGVFQSEVLPVDVVSDARTDGEVVPESALGRREGDKQYLSLDHERTVESFDPDTTTGYHSDINIWRTHQSPWDQVTEADFDGLLARTDEYGRELAANFERIRRAA